VIDHVEEGGRPYLLVTLRMTGAEAVTGSATTTLPERRAKLPLTGPRPNMCRVAKVILLPAGSTS
jgi:hypothetical protein